MKRAAFRRSAWTCLAVLTLALAQWLGAVHGVVHTTRGEAVRHVHSGDQAHREAGSWLTALFTVHDDDTDCRLYDQAGHNALAPALASSLLPTAPASQVVDAARCEALARWAALFQARAPPFS
jgi:hypothetical protein